MKQSDYAALAEDRSRFFWWLAEWFLSPPDRASLDSLPVQEGGAVEVSDLLDVAWHALAAARPSSDSVLEALGVEYTRLFSGMQEGSGPPPPFESVWREDRLVGESTVAVIECYARAGFADIDLSAGPQDHLGVELKFIALLAVRETEAWHAEEAGAAYQRLEQQSRFLSEHLASWVPRWAEAIQAQSREPLYAALAGLLKAGLQQADAELTELLRLNASARP